jgi:hypothetical protein
VAAAAFTARHSRHRGAAAGPGPLIRRALLEVKSSILERNSLRIGEVFALL